MSQLCIFLHYYIASTSACVSVCACACAFTIKGKVCYLLHKIKLNLSSKHYSKRNYQGLKNSKAKQQIAYCQLLKIDLIHQDSIDEASYEI